jgi:hypothetical protein
MPISEARRQTLRNSLNAILISTEADLDSITKNNTNTKKRKCTIFTIKKSDYKKPCNQSMNVAYRACQDMGFYRSALTTKTIQQQQTHPKTSPSVFYYLLQLIGVATGLGCRQFNEETYKATAILAKKLMHYKEIQRITIPKQVSVLTENRIKRDQSPAKPNKKNKRKTRRSVRPTTPSSEEEYLYQEAFSENNAYSAPTAEGDFDEESFTDNSTYSASTGEESSDEEEISIDNTPLYYRNTSNSPQPHTLKTNCSEKLPTIEPSSATYDPTLYQQERIKNTLKIPIKRFTHHSGPDSSNSSAFFQSKKRSHDDQKSTLSRANYTIISKKSKRQYNRPTNLQHSITPRATQPACPPTSPKTS